MVCMLAFAGEADVREIAWYWLEYCSTGGLCEPLFMIYGLRVFTYY